MKPAKTCRVLTAILVFVTSQAWAKYKKINLDTIGHRIVAHRSIIAEEKEIAIGRQLSEQIDKSAKLFRDPVVVNYVDRVAQGVARNSDLKIPLTVRVIDAHDICAFALPGGYLYVSSGLIKFTGSEAELAEVIAHGIAHIAARHWASEVTQEAMLGALTGRQGDGATQPIKIPMTGSVESIDPIYSGVFGDYGRVAPLFLAKARRENEEEADYLGLEYVCKAGYDPNAYSSFLKKLLKEEQRRHPPDASLPQILTDFPPTAQRVRNAEEEVKQLPQHDHYLDNESEFRDIKAHLSR